MIKKVLPVTEGNNNLLIQYVATDTGRISGFMVLKVDLSILEYVSG